VRPRPADQALCGFVLNSGIALALCWGMREEMKFLKYRRDVVSAWPESPRKKVFLAAIEARMHVMQRELETAPAGTDHLEEAA
jgi:hypothetical protein